MADKTKYYYLKIKENFFDTEDMKLLESMDNGYLYSNILMKMYLLSLKSEGKLMYKNKIPYSPKMLSTILGHNSDVIEKAISIFKELNLIEILDTGAIFMLDIQNFIGKSSDEADRKRKYRAKIESEKGNLLLEDKCPDISPTNCSNIRDRERDRERDKDRDRDNGTSAATNNLYEYIEENFGRTLSPIEYEKVLEWEDNELTRYAIKNTILRGICNLSYIDTVLRTYKRKNIKTVQQAQQEHKNFKGEKEVPSWFDKKYEGGVSDEAKEFVRSIEES